MFINKVTGVLTVCLALLGCSNHPTNFDMKDYKIFINIRSNTEFENINAHVYDSHNTFIEDFIFKVDNNQLTQNSGNYHYYEPGPWPNGSFHSYYVQAPDGSVSSGTFQKPVDTLAGVIYSPASPTIATAYTITPPDGTWPEGSYISCTIWKDLNYMINYEPVGNSLLVVDDSLLNGALNIYFTSSIIDKIIIPEYAPGSMLTITGTSTLW